MRPHNTGKDKPFKHKIRNKRFTIMFVPNTTEKIRRINIPYWVLSMAAVPFLFVIAIVVLYQLKIADLGALAGRHEDNVRDSAARLGEAVSEIEALEEQLRTIEELLRQSEAETEAVRTLLNSYDDNIAQLYAKIHDIDNLKKNILDVFDQLHEQNIPFSFDEAALIHYDETTVSSTIPDEAQAAFAEADVLLARSMLDFQVLEEYTAVLSSYFKARPSGMPVQGGVIGAGFGYIIDPFTGEGYVMHNGIDISAGEGDEVYATADGTVVFSGWSDNEYGYLVIIEHAFGYSTYYAHNSGLVVAGGERVTRGQLIAYAGSTGRTIEPHCHYEVREDGITQDPRLFIR